jgi:hypothetical protein
MDTEPAPFERYDPWHHLIRAWPEVEVVLEPMSGTLLGELRYPTIALRADSSAAQQRCTLAHELVHLERGGGGHDPWMAREEIAVHAEAARRLVGLADLERALRELGGDTDLPALARLLDVDLHTAVTRLGLLAPRERHWVRSRLRGELWSVA